MSGKHVPRALVLLSGGLDSAVALYWAISKHYRVSTLTFNYYHRSRRETEAAKQLSLRVRRPNYEIDLKFLKEIEDSADQKNKQLLSAPSAYIPSRNVIFYGIATSIAEITDTKFIVGGHNREDSFSFPDSSQDFFDHFNKTTSIGLFTRNKTGRVILPLAGLTKAQVISLGLNLRVPFESTWSCHRQNRLPCGKCQGCVMRERAFESLGVIDPLQKISRTLP